MEFEKLDDIFPVIRNGANIKQTPNKAGKPITRIETIVDNKIDLNRVGYADILNDNYQDFYLKSGDILMSHINSVTHLGKVAIVENIDTDIIHGMNLLVLKSDIFKVFPKYSYYYFLTNKFRKQLIPITKKSINQASFNVSDIKEIQIPLPSYENQIRIAHLLEKIETTITERKTTINLLDELVKATFYQMFNKERKIKDITLEDLAKDEQHSISSGPFGSNLTSADYVTNGVLVLRGKNITNGRLNLSDSKFVSLKKAEELKRSKIKPDDVVIVAVGSSGNALRIPNEIPDAIMSQNFNKITPNKDLVNPVFLADMINSEFVQKQFRDVTTNAGRTFLGLSKVRNITIPYYHLDLQNQFADIAQKIEGIKAEQEAQLKNLEELYASVSHKVFEGDIELSKVPFDANLLPNPIEVTLEKPTKTPDVVVKKEITKEKKNITKGKLTWEIISFKEVADYIRQEFDGHYFNAEMLLRFLRENIGMQVNYFSSVEQKKNPQYENADDFYRFIASALTGENHFLTLEQVFYNAETENISNISFTETDLENLSKKDKKERSGIYFHIKDETTTP